jgi:hypothetical protein
MKYILTFLITLIIISFSVAQKGPSTADSTTGKETERLLNLENQIKTQQLVLNKQKAALDSLGKENIVLKAHQDGYSNNVTVLTALVSIISTVAIFIVGFVLPNLTFNKIIKEAKEEFDKANNDSKAEFKMSLDKSEVRIKSLENNILEKTKELRSKGIGNTIDFCRIMMLLTYEKYDKSDTYMFWAINMYDEVLKLNKIDGEMEFNEKKQSALKFMNAAIKKPINDFRLPEKITSSLQDLLTYEKNEQYIDNLKKVKEGYNKLYYASLARKEESSKREKI